MDAALGMLAERRLQGLMAEATLAFLERVSQVQQDEVTLGEALQLVTDLSRRGAA